MLQEAHMYTVHPLHENQIFWTLYHHYNGQKHIRIDSNTNTSDSKYKICVVLRYSNRDSKSICNEIEYWYPSIAVSRPTVPALG